MNALPLAGSAHIACREEESSEQQSQITISQPLFLSSAAYFNSDNLS